MRCSDSLNWQNSNWLVLLELDCIWLTTSTVWLHTDFIQRVVDILHTKYIRLVLLSNFNNWFFIGYITACPVLQLHRRWSDGLSSKLREFRSAIHPRASPYLEDTSLLNCVLANPAFGQINPCALARSDGFDSARAEIAKVMWSSRSVPEATVWKCE